MARLLHSPGAGPSLQVSGTNAAIARWKLDEASGNALDAIGTRDLTENAGGGGSGGFSSGFSSGFDIGGGGSIAAAASLYKVPIGSTGARDLDGASYFSRSATGDSAWATAWQTGPLSLSVLFELDSLTGTIFFSGGDSASETDANAIGLHLYVESGTLKALWEDGATDRAITASSTGVALQTGVRYLAIYTRAGEGFADEGQCSLEVWRVDTGERLFRVEATPGAHTNNGSPTCSIVVGAGWGGADPLDGRIEDVIAWSIKLDDAARDELAASYCCQIDEATVIGSGHHAAFLEVELEDSSGAWVSLADLFGYDWTISADFGEGDIDEDVSSARVTIAARAYDLNLAPFVAGSPINLVTGGGAEFLRLTQRARIRTAVAPIGSERIAPGAPGCLFWRNQFEGTLAGWTINNDEIDLELVDYGGTIQDTWIEHKLSFGDPDDYSYGSPSGTALETVLQEILDDQGLRVGAFHNNPEGTPQLYTPSSPGFNVREFVTPATQNVFQKLDELAGLIGWKVRYRWDPYQIRWRLTLYEPDRAATWASGAPEITADQVRELKSISVDRSAIRNHCEVEYSDSSSTDNTGSEERKAVNVSDATSIAKYGRRYCRVAVASVSELDSSTQATKLATAIVTDLKEPKAAFDLEVNYRPDLELEDLVRVRADGVFFDSDQDLALVEIRHRFDDGEQTTRLKLRNAKPAGRYDRHFDHIQERGRIGGMGLKGPRDPAGVTASPGVLGGRIAWTFPANNLSRAYKETEIHVGTSSGFTPSSSTLSRIVRGKDAQIPELPAGTTRYVKLIHRDQAGNVSGVSSAQTLTARWTPELPAFEASLASDQSYTSGFTLIDFDTIDHENGSNYNTTNKEFTAPVAGWYSIFALVRATLSSSGGTGEVELYTGSTRIALGSLITVTGTSCLPNLGGLFHLAQGATVRVRANFSKSATIVSSESRFAAALVAQD